MHGEFIGSGTVGNGCGLELGWFLEHGDSVELEMGKIGVLKNRVERQDNSAATDHDLQNASRDI
jgi:2-keto-4-pentenoate hydratase/2-oxohepta-3-ene-1,7-dioic acid hydratase in catechol pathway